MLKKTSINLPTHVVEDLDKIAIEFGVNRSTVMLWYIGQGIAAHKACAFHKDYEKH